MYAGASGKLVSATWYLRYVDRFERRDDWRVADRTVVLEHVTTRPTEPALTDATWVLARRDTGDHLWTALAALNASSD